MSRRVLADSTNRTTTPWLIAPDASLMYASATEPSLPLSSSTCRTVPKSLRDAMRRSSPHRSCFYDCAMLVADENHACPTSRALLTTPESRTRSLDSESQPLHTTEEHSVQPAPTAVRRRRKHRSTVSHARTKVSSLGLPSTVPPQTTPPTQKHSHVHPTTTPSTAVISSLTQIRHSIGLSSTGFLSAALLNSETTPRKALFTGSGITTQAAADAMGTSVLTPIGRGGSCGDGASFAPYLLPPVASPPPLLTVVLDLDETLVSNRRPDLSSAVLRPYVLEALRTLRDMEGIELVLWTASMEETASPVIDQLSVAGKVFDHVVCRSNLWFTEPVHTKDLRLLNRDMGRVVVFDNASNCCKLNPQVAVLVEDFTGANSPQDTVMVSVVRVVERLVGEARTHHRSTPEVLLKMADEEFFHRRVNIPLPEIWAGVDLSDWNPLLVPAHGQFYKLFPTTMMI